MNRALIEMAGELNSADMSATSENCRDWANSYIVDGMASSLGIFYNAIETQYDSKPDLAAEYLYYYTYMSTIRLLQIERIHMLSLEYGEKELATRLEGRIKAIKNEDKKNLKFNVNKNDYYSKTMDRIYWKGVNSNQFKIIDGYRKACGLRSITTYYSSLTKVIGVSGSDGLILVPDGKFYIRENNKWIQKASMNGIHFSGCNW